MLWGGGRERRIVQLIAGLNRLGINNITLILLDERVDYPEVFDMNVEIVKIHRAHNRDLSVFNKIYDILKNAGPCIVNPWSYMSVFYTAPVCRALKIPCLGAFVVDAKLPRKFSVNWISMKIGFALCRSVIGNSQAGHDAYGTPRQKRIVIYNGYDAKRLANVPLTKPLYSTIRIAMIGRLDRQKDYHTYIDALAVLADRGVLFQSFIVGQGDDWDVLRAYAAKRCEGRIEFTGFMRDIDVFISGIDIGVLCTDPAFHAEGISNALVEIMAQGKPVVATHGGGTPEIVSDGRNGFLVPPRDSWALADKLQKLCEDPELRDSLGREAGETIETKFSLNRMALEFRQAYHECL